MSSSIENLTLRLLWPNAAILPVNLSPPTAFTSDDWQKIDTMAGQYRLRPLLHHHATGADWNAAVPAPIRAKWQAAADTSLRKFLTQKATLQIIEHLFHQAGIEAVILKGGDLCNRGWLNPTLRPMRDLDILVDTDQAQIAHKLLREHNFIGQDTFESHGGKHLPPLISNKTGTYIEIHTKIFDTANTAELAQERFFRQTAWLRKSPRITSPSQQHMMMHVFDSSDLLLHIIMHGVMDHKFNTGLLLMLDITTLADQSDMNWPQFWQSATAIGAVRPCQLALSLAQNLQPELKVDWLDHAPKSITPMILNHCFSLMMRDEQQHKSMGWITKLASWPIHTWPKNIRESIQQRQVSDKAKTVLADNQPHISANNIFSRGRQFLKEICDSESRTYLTQSRSISKWLKS